MQSRGEAHWGRAWMPLCAVVIVAAGCSTASAHRTTQGSASTGAVRPTVSEARSCATSEPATWMGCIASRDPGFADIPLSEIAIPGAHDSGTFNLDASDFDTQSGSSCTSYTPLFTKVAALVKRWSEAQNIDFTSQLDDGVRYLDFRLAYTGNAKQGWRIVHTQFSNDPLRQDLASIAAWAKAHPTEVVVIDVQHLCYDNSPTAADDLDLWSDFSVLAPVIFDPGTRSVADSTLRDITGDKGPQRRAHAAELGAAARSALDRRPRAGHLCHQSRCELFRCAGPVGPRGLCVGLRPCPPRHRPDTTPRITPSSRSRRPTRRPSAA